jgi:hypothetical protein
VFIEPLSSNGHIRHNILHTILGILKISLDLENGAPLDHIPRIYFERPENEATPFSKQQYSEKK